MIAANVAAAKALEAKKAPVMYRDHEPPSREKLVALKDYLDTFDIAFALGQVVKPATFNHILERVQDPAIRPQVMEQVLRSQTQAYYAPANTGISGSRLAATRISPARSGAMPTCSSTARWWAPGGWSRRCARAGCRSPMQSAWTSSARRSAGPSGRAMEAERETVDRYVAAYLATHVGQVLDTRITGVRPFGFFATVTSIGGDGLVPSRRSAPSISASTRLAGAGRGGERGSLRQWPAAEAAAGGGRSDQRRAALRAGGGCGERPARRGGPSKDRRPPGAAGRARIAARRDAAAGRETSATAEPRQPILNGDRVTRRSCFGIGVAMRGTSAFVCAVALALGGIAQAEVTGETVGECVPFARAMSGIQLYGNAWTWWEQAGSRYRRGQTPRKGAVLVFRPNGVMQYGHVAVVSQVIGPGVLMVTHSNWSRIGGHSRAGRARRHRDGHLARA
jgi:hypothetical protein